MKERAGIQFTEREWEICLLVAKLRSGASIAHELGISARTVEKHIHNAARQIPGKGQPMKKVIRFFST